MPPTPDRLATYHNRRGARLRSLPRARSLPAAGGSNVWYAAGELLVLDEERNRVERFLSSGRRATGRDEEVVPGLRRYIVDDLDVPAAVRALRAELPAGANVVCPNHILLSTPFNQGGPFGPPTPVVAAELAGAPARRDAVSVAIIDTGLWADTALPETFFRTGTVDLETETDVDNDGLLDGDVGHANFIAGVIAQRTRRIRINVFKVLDTIGVCTEDDVVRALDRLDPAMQVVNLSLGGYTDGDLPPMAVQGALQRAMAVPDRVVVAAAGNDGNRVNRFWPAAFASAGESWSDRVAAVAAHDGRGLCKWSNGGAWVSVAAPGEDVRSTLINHAEFFPTGWAEWSGTSFATPYVAAEVVDLVAGGRSAPEALRRVIDAAPVAYDGVPALP
jgi:thermitase